MKRTFIIIGLFALLSGFIGYFLPKDLAMINAILLGTISGFIVIRRDR